MDTKSGQLKNKSKSEISIAPGDTQESANGKKLNAFDVQLMEQFSVHLITHLKLFIGLFVISSKNQIMYKLLFILFIITLKGALQDLYKSAQKDALETALKGTLQVTHELHLFKQLSMHKSIRYDSAKGEIEVDLKAHPRFHSREHLKQQEKLMIYMSAQLIVHLRVN